MDDEARELQALQQEMADIMDKVSALKQRTRNVKMGHRAQVIDELWAVTMRAWLAIQDRIAAEASSNDC